MRTTAYCRGVLFFFFSFFFYSVFHPVKMDRYSCVSHCFLPNKTVDISHCSPSGCRGGDIHDEMILLIMYLYYL